MALDMTDSIEACARIIAQGQTRSAEHQLRVRDPRRLRVLQIDGGGFLGYVCFASLKVLEARCPNGRLCNTFDVIYGTSTGAIIGAALAAGASVAEIEALYLEHGAHIFTPVNSWWLPWRKVTRPIYDRTRVIEPLRKILERYNVTKMSDLKTRFVAVTVDECKRTNVFQKSWKPAYHDVDVTDAVARSFAALFYFGHYPDTKNFTYYSDGATGALNCALQFSYFEAQAIAIANDRINTTNMDLLPVTDIDIYSFGCGTVPLEQSYSEVSRFGNIRQLWHTYLANGNLLARVQSTQDQVRSLQWLIEKQVTAKDWRGTDVHLVRCDAALAAKINKIDKPRYLTEYKAAGAKMAQQYDALLRFNSDTPSGTV